MDFKEENRNIEDIVKILPANKKTEETEVAEEHIDRRKIRDD